MGWAYGEGQLGCMLCNHCAWPNKIVNVHVSQVYPTNYLIVQLVKMLMTIFLFFICCRLCYLCASKEAPSDNRRAQCMPCTIHKQATPCDNIQSYFLYIYAVQLQSRQDCSGPPTAIHLDKGTWPLATPLVGRGLTVFPWVRRDTGPAQGEKIVYTVQLCCVNIVQLNFFQEVQVHTCVQRFGYIPPLESPLMHRWGTVPPLPEI